MHIEAFVKDQEDKYQREWEIARAISYNFAKFSGNMKNPNTSMLQFWPLPWEKKTVSVDLMAAAKAFRLKNKMTNGRINKPGS